VRRSISYALLILGLVLIAPLIYRSTWMGSAQLHTLIETICTVLTLTTGAMALVRYYTKKSSAYLLLGSGFLGTAILNGFHTAITSTFLAGRMLSPLSPLIRWSGAVPQIYLSLILCGGLLVWKIEVRRRAAIVIKESYVYCLMGLWTVATFILFAFVPVPQAFYPGRFISQPTDLIQVFLFTAATIGYFFKGAWKDDDFEHWLEISLIFGTAQHLGFLSHSKGILDAAFFTAHTLMMAQYGSVLVGLFISMHSIFKREAENAARLSQVNQSLATEVLERQRVAEALRQAHDELEERVEARTQDLSRANEELAEEINGRKAAEDELRQSSELVMLLLASTPEAIYGLNMEGQCTFANSACVRQLGYQASTELLGRSMHEVLHHSRPDGTPYPEAECPLYHAFRAGTGIHAEDEVFWRKDGTSFPTEYWSRPIHKREKVIGAVVTFLDVTERKRVEQSLRRAKEAAESASLAKSEFLANMSHEIRTPMNGIIGMTDLALETELTQEQREFLDIVRTSADSLLSLLNDILDFSKIEAGKLDIETIAFNLRDALDDAMKTVSFRAHQKGLELVCYVRPDVPDALQGDPTRLRQIVLNLLGNAVKFTTEGEILLTVEIQKEIDEAVVLRFGVADTGIGIPQEKQGAIFEAFTQADTSTTRKFGGTGLGLAICSRIVNMIGGRIWVESEAGRGSTFYFEVRFLLQKEAPIRYDSVDSEILRDLPVLVVDDNATNRRILEETLVGWGMRPTLAESGEHAMAALEQIREVGGKYPLILLDAQMPGLNGFSVAKAIKQDSNHSCSVIVMLTSVGMRGDAERCRELGINAYLPKPIRRSDLLEAIKLALRSPQRTEKTLPVITRHLLRENRRQLKILLAEDNLVNQKLAVRLLEKRGHTVTVAGTGVLAVQAYETQSFDIVLMDVQMPEMDGLEATAAIRRCEKINRKHVPIVAMTAHAMVGDKELCLRAGMDGYVTKPLNVAELFAAIDEVLLSPIQPSAI
jgi:PAS domain S-box-containing protein